MTWGYWECVFWGRGGAHAVHSETVCQRAEGHVPAAAAAVITRETYIKEEPGETPNDRNDRAIRVATKW
jgi:hypothetical protein